MGRRNDIDWEAIERDYRAGQLSVREIGAKHQVAPSSITRKAEKLGWTRDLTAAVHARTQAKLIEPKLPAESAQSNENATQRAQSTAEQTAEAVEVAAAVNVAVILGHRGSIARVRSIADAMLVELENGAKARGKKAALPLEKRVTMVKSLSEALRIQVGLERQAFNIADGATDLTDPLSALLADLMKRRSAVPIAEDVE
jgi:hypothetical protein